MIALNLHEQFAHRSSKRLICLLNNAGTPWCDNTDLEVLLWKNTSPHYQSLYMIVRIHCCFKQKPRYNN